LNTTTSVITSTVFLSVMFLHAFYYALCDLRHFIYAYLIAIEVMPGYSLIVCS